MREHINLFISAFLVLGFGVCAYFFSTISGNSLSNSMLGNLVYMLIFVLFGLILFYATRVGDGKQIKRFNPAGLILIVLPAIYVITAYILDFMPLHEQLAQNGGMTAAIIAAMALGYGVPYTFLSGYEINDAPEEESGNEESTENIDEKTDEDEVDYSEIKTLDIALDEDGEDGEAENVENAENEDATEDSDPDNGEAAAEEPAAEESTEDGEEAKDEISADTEKTIRSVIDENAEL